MTMYLIVGGTTWLDLATTRGWGDVTRWAELIDNEKIPLLSHLIDHGWVNEAALLPREITKALKLLPPEPSVRETLEGLKENLSKHVGRSESVTISDGLTADEDDDDDEWWIGGKPVRAEDEEDEG